MKKQAKRTGAWLLNQYDQICQKLKPGEVERWKKSLSAENFISFQKAKGSLELPSELEYVQCELKEALRLKTLNNGLRKLAVFKALKMQEERRQARSDRRKLRMETKSLKVPIKVTALKKVNEIIPVNRTINRECQTDYLSSGKMVIHLDSKTQITVKAGRDPEVVKQAFLNRHQF